MGEAKWKQDRVSVGPAEVLLELRVGARVVGEAREVGQVWAGVAGGSERREGGPWRGVMTGRGWGCGACCRSWLCSGLAGMLYAQGAA